MADGSPKGQDVEQLLLKLYNSLGDNKYKLVKGKWKESKRPDVVVTAFHHFGAVASAAYKICSILERVEKLEGWSEKCFWAGVLHDYEKVWKTVEDALKELKPPISLKETEVLAACTEAMVGTPREYRIACYALMLSDFWASKRSVSEFYPTDERYSKALSALESLGLRFVPVFSGVPKAVMSVASGKMIELFRKKGWHTLFVYSDGMILVGTKDSKEIDAKELAEVFYDVLRGELAGGEAQRKEMERKLKPFENAYSLFEEFMGLTCDEIKEEIENAKKDKSKRKNIVPLLAAAIKKGCGDLVKEVENYVLKNRKTLQVRALIGNPYYFDEIVKANMVSSFLEMAADKPVALLAFALAFRAKDKVHEKVKEILGKKLNEISVKGKPYQPLVFAELLAVLSENEKLIEKLIEEIKKEGKEDEGLKLYANYLACNAISSPIIEGECVLPKPKARCYICGGPTFSTDLTFDKYMSLASGGRAKGSEIYLPRQTPYVGIESSKVKQSRVICPGCAFEATLINERLSAPFAAFALHPAVAPEMLSFVAGRLEDVSKRSLLDLCSGKEGKEVKGWKAIVDYAHALILLKMQLKRDEIGFGAHGATVARFLAYAGFFLESAGGGQAALAWEIPLYMASEPVSVPHLPGWLNEVIELSLVKADNLAPLVYALKAWAQKVCSVKTVDELRDVFHSSDLSPHPSLALLAPPKGWRGELDSYLPTFLKVLREVEKMEEYMEKEDRLVPKLWNYAYRIVEALKASRLPPSKHRVQGPLRTALYRLVDYLEAGLKPEDAVELAAGAAQEDAERTFGRVVDIEKAVKDILNFTLKYVKEMNPAKRRMFFEDMLDVAYLMVMKLMRGGKDEGK